MFSLILAVLKPIAYISVPVFIINAIASSSQKGQYYVRSATYVSSMAAASAYGFFVAVGLAAVGEKYNVNYVVARLFYYTTSRIMDIELEVEGEEHLAGPALMVCNHQSMLDIFVLGRFMPKQSAMTSKRSLQFTPLGPFMTLSGAVFLDRGNNARAVRSLQAAGELIRQKRLSIWIFPEGTRHNAEEVELLPFKKGPFHLAVQAEMPILPIVVENYWKLYRPGYFGKGVIKVKVLPPISTTGLSASDVQDLSVRVRDQMLSTLREISTPSPPPGPNEKGDLLKPSGAAFRSDPVDVQESPTLKGLKQGSIESISTVSEGVETEEDEGMVLVDKPT